MVFGDVCLIVLLWGMTTDSQQIQSSERDAGERLPSQESPESPLGSTQTSLQQVEDAWMCSPKLAPPRIVWNRIYKTAALPMNNVLSSLAKRNNFT